jgi:hypothetical protein
MADGSHSFVAGSRPDAAVVAAVPVDLRPLTTSELVDRGFSLYRANFAGFLLLALLCQIAPLLSHVLITALRISPLQSDFMGPPDKVLGKAGIVMGILLVTQIIVFCFEVIITSYVADAYLGKIPSVKESFRRFVGCMSSSIWTCLLNIVLLSLSLLFPIIAVSAALIYEAIHPPVEFLPLILFMGGSGLLFIVSLIPILIVFMRLMVTVPVVALEGLSGWKAVRRSSTLVRYDPGLGILYWGEMRLSFLLLPLFVIELLALSLTSLPVTIHQISELVRNGAGGQIAAPPDSTVIVTQILTFFAVSLILPLYSIATTLFYFDVRIRREGFDLEFMAGKLGDQS